MSLIVGIDNDKLEFIEADGQLVVTVKNLTEAIVDREVFLDAYITHCKDCKHETDHDCPINWGKTGEDFCSFAEKREE